MTDQQPRPDVKMFLDFLNNVPGPKMHELDPASARQMMVAMRAVADAEPTPLPVIRNIAIPGPAGDIPARIYDARPQRDEAGPVMVFFHGGGFVIGDLDTHEPYCTEAVRVLDMPVIAIDYRLAPEAKWPAAPDDCEAATRWIAGSPAELGYTVTGLVLSGDSAGGNLTIVTAMALRDAPAAVPVIVQVPLYPATAGEGQEWASVAQFGEGHLLTNDTMNWFMAHYAPGDHVRAAPLHGSHHAMPPTLVVTAGLDPLRDQGRAYAAKLIEAGVPTSYREAVGNVHGFICLRKGIPSSATDIANILSATKEMVAEALRA